jgi:predicted secreted protein
MSWTLGLASYFVIWWTTLFAVLPFEMDTQHQAGEVVPGSEPGAPTKFRIGRKVLINTLAAAVVWAVIDAAYIYFYLRTP